jgi:hypothetical protein
MVRVYRLTDDIQGTFVMMVIVLTETVILTGECNGSV